MNLNLPSDAALNLEELIPEPVLNDLKSKNWDMEKMKEKLIASKLAPQELYKDKINSKNYRIWLE